MSTAFQKEFAVFSFDVRQLKMTDKTFYEFCQRNKEHRFEMDKQGNLIVMPPTFLETSRINNEINFYLTAWAKKDKTGIAFESDGMFTLPNGAKRAPDAFWILKERYFALSQKERKEKFARICPDFAIELRSNSDNLRKLQNKMRELLKTARGSVGWLTRQKNGFTFIAPTKRSKFSTIRKLFRAKMF